MPTPVSERRYFLLEALSRRGITGPPCLVLLHKFAHARIARQIDYYDFEIDSPRGLNLPLWAAAPWLEHRIRKNLAPPRGYRPSVIGPLSHFASIPRGQHRRAHG
jgi:hypothetical protein